MDTTIIANTKPKHTYAAIAAVLREVADALDTLNADQLAPLIVGLTLQPGHNDEDVEVATVDAIAEAIGTAGKTIQMSSGSWHYHAERKWPAGAGTRVAAFCGITAPEEKAAREEAAQLRAEVEALRAKVGAYEQTQAGDRAKPDDGSEVGPELDSREPVMPRLRLR